MTRPPAGPSLPLAPGALQALHALVTAIGPAAAAHRLDLPRRTITHALAGARLPHVTRYLLEQRLADPRKTKLV